MKCMQLVVCEKPSVAATLAKALGVTERKNGYIEGDNIIVSWCIGHLVELVNADAYRHVTDRTMAAVIDHILAVAFGYLE